MKKKKDIIEYLSKTDNPYKLSLGDITIEMEYSKNNKYFNECVLNILRQKSKIV